MDKLEPKRVHPYTLKPLRPCPIRTKLRMDSELPTWQKSKTEREEPSRATPNTERLDPKRLIVRNDNALPMVT
jgi:hypothetical protein